MSRPSKPNGYQSFCWEWKTNKEKEGYHYNNIREVIADEEVYKAWKNLSEDSKDFYRLLAKCDSHHSQAGDRRKSSDSYSSSRSSVSRRSSFSSTQSGPSTARGPKKSSCKPAQATPQPPPLNRKFRGSMEEYMSYLMKYKNQQNCVQNLTFYVAHANYFYIREMDNGNSDYYPVELAVAECSLERGVQRVHHVIVKEEIFTGYRHDAVTRSQESHKIPIDVKFDFKVDVETDYAQIFQGICRFMEPGSIDGELPPLFTIRTNDEHIWKPVKSIFGRLAAADFKHPEFFLQYSFEELFAYLFKAVTLNEKKDFDMPQAIDRLEKDPNNFRNGFGCEYHKEIGDEGELHCSSSFVKRWWWRVCEDCCDPLGIEKIPGSHSFEDTQPQQLVFTKLNLKPKFNHSRDSRGSRDSRDSRNPRDPRNSRDSRDPRDPRDINDRKGFYNKQYK